MGAQATDIGSEMRKVTKLVLPPAGLMLLSVLLLGGWNYSRTNALRQRGVAAVAQVEKIQEVSGRSSRGRVYVTVVYRVSATKSWRKTVPIGDQDSISDERIENIRRTRVLPIVFDPDAPGRLVVDFEHEFYSRDPLVESVHLVAVGGVIITLVLALVFFGSYLAASYKVANTDKTGEGLE